MSIRVGLPVNLRTSRRGLSVSYFGSTTAAFAPSDVSGLIAWYKADAISALSDGDPIGSWADSSSSAYDLSAAAGARPTYKTDGPNTTKYASFNGTANFMASGNIAAVTDDYCMFLVAKPAATGVVSKYVIDPAAGSSDSQTIIYGFEDSMFEAYDGPRVNLGTYDGSNWAIYELNDDNSNRVGLKNGTQTESAAVAAGNNVAGGVPLYVGAGAPGASFYAGGIAEFLWYSASVSAPNRALIRSYLGTKYNITVS